MNKYISIFLTTILIGLGALHAQKKELTISDAVIGQYRQLYPSYLRNLDWQGDGNVITYLKRSELVKQDLQTGDETVLLTMDQLNKVLNENDLDSVRYFPGISWKDAQRFSFNVSGRMLMFDLKENSIKEDEMPPSEKELTKSENGFYAFQKEKNLFIINGEKDTMQVTKDGKPGIVYGESVHRNEFGISGGLFWSPESNFLAFYRMDETMVTDYPLVDVNTRIAETKMIKYPMAGMQSHHVSLGVYSLAKDSVVYMKTGEPLDQYLTCITWSPDEKYIYIALLNRGQNHVKLNKYDALTGEFVSTLFEEKHEKYVEPENALFFINNNEFIWQSERDGFNHLYLYNSKGELLKQLTSGSWEVSSIVDFDKNNHNLFLYTTKESPIENHFYKLNINDLELIKLTRDPGTHRCSLSDDFTYFLDDFSSVEVAKGYNVISSDGSFYRNIKRSEDPTDNYKMGEMSIFTIKAADGVTDLYCRLIKPYDYNPRKSYPAVIYVYGGPHAQMVTNSWLGGARLWNYYMAQNGYVMLTIDNRGSAHRGLEFENVIHRNVGKNEMADQMEGIKYLESLGYVDMDRIGVHGWSYGGFMTTTLMTSHPDVFKVGVAGGPVIDWKYYEIMYGERYMDTPDENPDGYEESSLLPDARNLKGKLLLIHGAQDPVVVWQHSQAFLNECIKNNKQVDYFIYPDHEHNVRGYDRIHLMDKVSQYFDDYLKGDNDCKKRKSRRKRS